MKRASVRDLHLKTSAIVSDAAGGEVYVIEKRGVPVVELRPVDPPHTRRLPNRDAFFAKFPQVKLDSGKIIEEDRNR